MRPGGITKRRSPSSRSSDFCSRIRFPIGAPRSIGPRLTTRNGSERTSSLPRRSQATPPATSSASASAIQSGGLRGNGDDKRDGVERPVDQHARNHAVRPRPNPGEGGAKERQDDETLDEPVHRREGNADAGDSGPAAQLLEQRVAEAAEEELLDERCDERDN